MQTGFCLVLSLKLVVKCICLYIFSREPILGYKTHLCTGEVIWHTRRALSYEILFNILLCCIAPSTATIVAIAILFQAVDGLYEWIRTWRTKAIFNISWEHIVWLVHCLVVRRRRLTRGGCRFLEVFGCWFGSWWAPYFGVKFTGISLSTHPKQKTIIFHTQF